MPTLFYSPSVEIHIGTSDGKVIDVSDDITQGEVLRIINGVSSAQFELKNQGSKYDGLFDTMDKVVIYLRRLSKMLVFSGYLDSAPSFTVYARTVTLKASCTLKILQNWPWDPGTPAAYSLLYDNGNTLQSDANLTRQVISMLTKVAQWDRKRVHIGSVPRDWMKTLASVADKLVAEADAAQMALQVGSSSYIGGVKQEGEVHIQTGIPGTGDLPSTGGRATLFGGGPLTNPPSSNDPGAHGGFALTGETYPHYRDLWYCAMRWGYVDPNINTIPGVDVAKAKTWWKNRLIMVVNPSTKRACAVRAADWGPASSTGNSIDLGPSAMAYLTKTEHQHPLGSGAGAIDEVHISFAPASITKPGPIDLNPKSAAVGQALQSVGTGTSTVSKKNDPTLGGQIVAYASTFIGVPYVYSGTSPSGFDCSGLVQYVFKHFGIALPRVANDQSKVGTKISASQAQAGDLVFFHGDSSTSYSHVAICTGGGYMIAAPHTGTDVQKEQIYTGARGPNLYKRIIGVAGGDHSGGPSGPLPKVCPFATQKILPYNDSMHARSDDAAAVLHTNAGTPRGGSLYGVFVNSGPTTSSPASAHFQVMWDGTIEQYLTTDRQADHAFAANAFAIGIETQDDGDPSKPWTPKQIGSILRLCNWIGCLPQKLADNGIGGGIGWHREYTDWNTDSHTCPGDVRQAQILKDVIPNVVPSQGTTSDTTTSSSAAAVDPADVLFNIWAWLGQIDRASTVLGGIRALMNDTPILTTIDTFMRAGMRQYSSAPNGDFIGWFPDYFGHYGTAAKLIVEDIEVQRDFAVAKSDPSLRTHVYVTSTGAPAPAQVGEPGPTDIVQMIGTAGVATVEFPELMKAIFGIDPKDDKTYSSDYILNRYGARVDWTPMSNISGARAEFFFATMRFAENWARQYAAVVDLTFMPEAWPGMLMQMPKYGFQAYIQQVTHNFNLQEGGGFSTNVTLIAPSSVGPTPIKGLPLGGVVREKKSKKKHHKGKS